MNGAGSVPKGIRQALAAGKPKPEARKPAAKPPKKRPFKLTPYLAPEDHLHKAVTDALVRLLPESAVVQTFESRNAASAVEGAKRKWRGMVAGFPDIGVFCQGKAIFFEIKREGGTVSPAQQAMHARLRRAWFAVYVLVGREAPAQALEACARQGIPVRGRVAA